MQDDDPYRSRVEKQIRTGGIELGLRLAGWVQFFRLLHNGTIATRAPNRINEVSSLGTEKVPILKLNPWQFFFGT